MTALVDCDGSLAVSRETRDRLELYVSLLRRWSARVNLVSPATLADAWTRHVSDCAQLLDHAPANARTWLDLGSGAGLPSLVVAAIAQDMRPALSVTAVESDARKAAFMHEAARLMGVLLDIRVSRIEALEPAAYDVVTARALAPLPKLLGLAQPFLHCVGLFSKGARHSDEIVAAARTWRFEHRVLPSRTDPTAAIVEIRRLQRVTT